MMKLSSVPVDNCVCVHSSTRTYTHTRDRSTRSHATAPHDLSHSLARLCLSCGSCGSCGMPEMSTASLDGGGVARGQPIKGHMGSGSPCTAKQRKRRRQSALWWSLNSLTNIRALSSVLFTSANTILIKLSSVDYRYIETL